MIQSSNHLTPINGQQQVMYAAIPRSQAQAMGVLGPQDNMLKQFDNK
jgi:hypothetical protein